MTLLELEPYIMGKKYTRVAKEPYRGDYALFDKIDDLIKRSNTAQSNLKLYEIPKEFYMVEPDIASFVPRQAREEIFYALKNGFITDEVPAKCIYYIRKAYNLYKIPNLIFKLIPEKEYTIFFQSNYMKNGLTIRDIICNFCDERYTPISSGSLKVPLGKFAEIYINSKDMVAVVPSAIAEVLSHEDILSLAVDIDGIKLGDTYLKFLADYNGACESTYDLRTLI